MVKYCHLAPFTKYKEKQRNTFLCSVLNEVTQFTEDWPLDSANLPDIAVCHSVLAGNPGSSVIFLPTEDNGR